MEHLKGKVILVGKEPGEGRLQVAIQGSSKTAVIGKPGSLPGSVSRCKVTEGVAHLKITVDANGNLTLANMKPQNVTYVNGSEIVSKHLSTTNATIELGKDRYPIDLTLVLNTAEKLVCGTQPSPAPHSPSQPYSTGPQTQQTQQTPVFNISHLELIWNDLQDKRHEMQAKQRRTNLIRTVCGIFTSSAILCSLAFGKVGYILTAIGVLGNIYSFWGMKNDHSTETIEKQNEEFQDHYICPNPDCGKFLGNISYKLLKKQYNMHCPYCKCEYVEK